MPGRKCASTASSAITGPNRFVMARISTSSGRAAAGAAAAVVMAAVFTASVIG